MVWNHTCDQTHQIVEQTESVQAWSDGACYAPLLHQSMLLALRIYGPHPAFLSSGISVLQRSKWWSPSVPVFTFTALE